MADKKDKKDDKKKTDKPKKTSHGEMSFGLEVILFVIAIFAIWVFTGKPRTDTVDKPFIKEIPITQTR